MSQFDQLFQATASERNEFTALPLIQDTLRNGASREVYLDFLGQAYHHVKHTVPLLALAAARCGPQDRHYQSALLHYIDEERGHDEWILEDIDALGGQSHVTRQQSAHFPCRVMVGHAYYVIEHVSPYGLLGTVHVLEGMSVALAGKAAVALRGRLQAGPNAGFKYLTTHGDLDVSHTEFFKTLIDEIDPLHVPVVIQAASDFYRLYGDMFRDIWARSRNGRIAA